MLCYAFMQAQLVFLLFHYASEVIEFITNMSPPLLHKPIISL